MGWNEVRETESVVADVREKLAWVKRQQRVIEVKRFLRSKDASGKAPTPALIARRAVFYATDPHSIASAITPDIVAQAVGEVLAAK